MRREPTDGTIERLQAWRGNGRARDALPLVHQELRRRTGAYLKSERPRERVWVVRRGTKGRGAS